MKVEYLGMIIEEGKISMDPGKLKEIQDWPTPTTVIQTWGFLGFGNFYRRFIQGLSNLAKPLNDLLKKDKKFEWTNDCQKAFDELKKKFTEELVLMMPDQTKPFQIKMDASKYATGAVLTQLDSNGNRHPISFISKTFSLMECNYEIYDRELLAIVCALTEWWHYIQGSSHTTHYNSPIRSQKFDLLPRSPEVELTTSEMVPLPIGIRHQTCTHTRTQNDPIRCPIPMTRFLPWGRHQQWRHHSIAQQPFHLSNWWKPSTMYHEIQVLWWNHDGSTQNPFGNWTYNNDKRTWWLDNGQIEWTNHPLLQRAQLHST